MRKRIGQIARGKFEYAKPILTFSEEHIDISVIEGTDETGSFMITCGEQMKIRGIVYSTNPRMECLTPNFEGEEVRIRYQFHSMGLDENEVSEGAFVIVCNNQQYSLSFCVRVTKLYTETSTGIIKNPDDFARLAREHWSESYKLFYSNNFKNIIANENIKERLLYKGYLCAKPSYQNLEEFLIGINKKQPIEISIDKNFAFYDNVTEDIRDSFEIVKNNWGYVEISLETDCDFIKFPKRIVTTDDFIGSTFRCDFIISSKDLHAGRNYGCIYLDTVYRSYQIEVVAQNYTESEKNSDTVSEHTDINECKVGIAELYQAYRLKQIVTGVWANETIDILNHLYALCQNEIVYLLMKAQIYIVNKQRQDAEWILDEFKRNWQDKKSPIWAYYLYLMTLMEREPAYIDKIAHEIELIFRDNPDSDLVFWILLFLKEQYFNNSSQKFKAIENWCLSGCASPYIYIEAYYLLMQEPYLLSKLGRFEIRLLRWAGKKRAFNKDIAEQIFTVVESDRKFDKRVYNLLCDAYQIIPEPENLGIICGYLIKAQKYEAEYHIWYEKGIEAELRITGLYEAFLLSMDDRQITAIPQIIQMYFQYDSKLSYRKLAVLYNNIIAAKNSESEIYNKYRKTIGRFAMEQVEQGHMDDNLAVIYEDMLDLGFINAELARALSKILFTNKLLVFDERIVRAIIYQKQFDEPQIVSVNDKVAYFQLYSSDYVIIFEDEKGYRYSGSASFRLQRLMNTDKYIEKCMDLVPDEIEYIIHHFSKEENLISYSENEKRYFKTVILNKEISSEYKSWMIPKMIKSFEEDDELVNEMLLQIKYEELSCIDRNYIINVIVKKRLYDEAEKLTRIYGIDCLSAGAKVNMASCLIKKSGEKDEFVLQLSLSAFEAHKYDLVILKYLCQYYTGPTSTMIEIWQAANDFELETVEIEEKIIDQQIYTGSDLNTIYDIFISYYKKDGRELTVLAYISAVANAYFRDDAKVKSEIFNIIENRYYQKLELNDICKLALLKSFSEIGEITEQQKAVEDELLANYTCQNMVFSFYSKLDRDLIKKYHLYDKVFLEYKGKSKTKVVLHYSRDEDGDNFIAEDMVEVYDGIYVKAFVMFFGEMIKYYISEESGNKVEVTESKRITNNNIYGEEDESRYNLINQMIISHTLQDDGTMYENMKEYNAFDVVTRKLFKLL